MNMKMKMKMKATIMTMMMNIMMTMSCTMRRTTMLKMNSQEVLDMIRQVRFGTKTKQITNMLLHKGLLMATVAIKLDILTMANTEGLKLRETQHATFTMDRSFAQEIHTRVDIDLILHIDLNMGIKVIIHLATHARIIGIPMDTHINQFMAEEGSMTISTEQVTSTHRELIMSSEMSEKE